MTSEALYILLMLNSHIVCNDHVFCAVMKDIHAEEHMMTTIVRHGLVKPTWGHNRNAHCLVPKRNGKYHFISSAVSANQHRFEDAAIPPNIKGIAKAFPMLCTSSLIEFISEYNQMLLHYDIQD